VASLHFAKKFCFKSIGTRTRRVQLEVGVTREKQKEKTPLISRIFTYLAKADINKALWAAMHAFSVLHYFNCCMDWLFKIREILVIRGVFSV
jgi:hypothetical protein